jgi:hypothetical protein
VQEGEESMSLPDTGPLAKKITFTVETYHHGTTEWTFFPNAPEEERTTELDLGIEMKVYDPPAIELVPGLLTMMPASSYTGEVSIEIKNARHWEMRKR